LFVYVNNGQVLLVALDEFGDRLPGNP